MIRASLSLLLKSEEAETEITRHAEHLYDSSAYYSRWMKAYTGRGLTSLSPFSPVRAMSGRTLALQPTLDSGASKHFSGVKSDFPQIKRWQSPRKVVTADGTSVDALGYSDQVWTTPQGELRLNEVWYVPSFGGVRLISIPQLIDNSISITFKRGKAIGIEDNGDGKIIFSVSRNATDNLFTLDKYYAVSALETSITDNVHNLEHAHRDFTDQPDPEEDHWELMHRRLGHINYDALQKLVKITNMKMPRFRPNASKQVYEACNAGKIRESFNKKTNSRVTRKGKRLYADISGKLSKSYKSF